MEKKMMMPASYNVMNEEEMTYTQGGGVFENILWAGGGLVGVVSIVNLVWGLDQTRNWIAANKKSNTTAADLVNKGVEDLTSYMGKSVFNTVVAVATAGNLAGWWPITAIAWATV